eukprot:1393333-Pyramimonas_sp.AAC.1
MEYSKSTNGRSSGRDVASEPDGEGVHFISAERQESQFAHSCMPSHFYTPPSLTAARDENRLLLPIQPSSA